MIKTLLIVIPNVFKRPIPSKESIKQLRFFILKKVPKFILEYTIAIFKRRYYCDSLYFEFKGEFSSCMAQMGYLDIKKRKFEK